MSHIINNVIVQGDCIEVMKTLPDESVDLVLTDPPYNVGLSYSTLSGTDNRPDEEYSEWFTKWLRELFRISKQGSFAIVFSGDAKLFYVFQAVMKSGYTYHHMLKWNKPHCQRGLSGTIFFAEQNSLLFFLKGSLIKN